MNAISLPSLYVYYRVPEGAADAARKAAARLAELVAAQGVEPPRLMRRPETDAQGQQTWMEVYASWDPAWTTIVDRAVVGSGLGALIEGPRHPELFIDLPSTEEGDEA